MALKCPHQRRLSLLKWDDLQTTVNTEVMGQGCGTWYPLPLLFRVLLFMLGAFHLVRTHLWGGGGVESLIYISIAYHMQKGGEGVQIACKIAYVLNGRPPSCLQFLVVKFRVGLMGEDGSSPDFKFSFTGAYFFLNICYITPVKSKR